MKLEDKYLATLTKKIIINEDTEIYVPIKSMIGDVLEDYELVFIDDTHNIYYPSRSDNTHELGYDNLTKISDFLIDDEKVDNIIDFYNKINMDKIKIYCSSTEELENKSFQFFTKKVEFNMTVDVDNDIKVLKKINNGEFGGKYGIKR